MFDIFLQQLANGLTIGVGYALVASGLTLVFGILGVLNFAHGELFMLSAYVLLGLMSGLGMPYGLGAVVAIVSVVALGAVCKAVVINPLMRTDVVGTLLGTFALGLFLHHAIQLTAGPTPKRIATPFDGVVFLGPVVLTEQRLLVLILGGAVLLALGALLKWTTIGRLMRSTAQNKQAAHLIGINVGAVENVTFGLGMAMAAIAGTLLGPMSPVSTGMGAAVIVKAFAVIVLGGMGSVAGAVLAGLMLGVAETFAAGYLSSSWSQGIAYLVLIAVLLIRPSGLLGVPGRG